MRRGALPGRNPGMRISRAILRKAASMALSNSASSTSTETFTLLPSRGSTVDRIGGSPYRGPPPISPTAGTAGTARPRALLVPGLEQHGDSLAADPEQRPDAFHREPARVQDCS